MHVEGPKKTLHSLREFASHYLMIVLSILTALGMEAWIENRHHAHAASEARERIEAELRENRTDLRDSMRSNDARLASLAALQGAIEQDFAQKLAPEAIASDIRARVHGQLDVGLFYPTLRQQAWDVAVANQSAGFMEPAVLERLSAAGRRPPAAAQGLRFGRAVEEFISVPVYFVSE